MVVDLYPISVHCDENDSQFYTSTKTSIILCQRFWTMTIFQMLNTNMRQDKQFLSDVIIIWEIMICL